MRVQSKFTAQLKLFAQWFSALTILRLFACLAACWLAYITYDLARRKQFLITQPFSMAMIFGTFTSCSIIFWHGILWPIISAPKSSSFKTLFTRYLDFIWYGAAIVSAVLVMNELQVNALEQTQNINNLSFERHLDMIRANGQKEIGAICETILPNYNESLADHFYVPFDKLRLLCGIDVTTRGGKMRFADGCSDANLINHENYSVFGKSVVNRTVGDALEKLSTVCTSYADAFDEIKKREDFEAALKESKWLYNQKSDAWLYIIALVIGLRLTRTTAEAIDATRDFIQSLKSNREKKVG